MNLNPSARPYFILNTFFIGVILLIMGYSFYYSPDTGEYPVPCIHEIMTGQPCPSCGLSHAFSLIVRGRVDEALQWNSLSLRVFLFFALQLAMRVALSVRLLVTVRGMRQMAITDATVSAAMALVAFFPFLRSLWMALF